MKPRFHFWSWWHFFCLLVILLCSFHACWLCSLWLCWYFCFVLSLLSVSFLFLHFSHVVVLLVLLSHAIIGVWCRLLLLLFSRCFSWTLVPLAMLFLLCYSFALLFFSHYFSRCHSHIAPHTLFPLCCSFHIIPLVLFLMLSLFLHCSFCTIVPFSLLLDSCITIFLTLFFSPCYSSHVVTPFTLLFLHYHFSCVSSTY